jgi:DNA-binding Lrp family transcriptional regulator
MNCISLKKIFHREVAMVAGVLINTDPAKTKKVYEQLKSLEGVANITAVFGRFDLVVMIRALDLDAGAKLIAKIREVEGVTATETLIATAVD